MSVGTGAFSSVRPWHCLRHLHCICIHTHGIHTHMYARYTYTWHTYTCVHHTVSYPHHAWLDTVSTIDPDEADYNTLLSSKSYPYHSRPLSLNPPNLPIV